jgi:hypothetical protein
VRWSILIGAAILACGCMETRRALGDDCLKNDDCLSGICSQLHCAAPPPLIDAQLVSDAAAEAPAAVGTVGGDASGD